jgi:hypothetical protein
MNYKDFEEFNKTVMRRMGIGTVIAVCMIAVAFAVWIIISTFM